MLLALESFDHFQIGIVINIRATHDLDLRFHFKAFHFLPILLIAVKLPFQLIFLQ